MENPLLLNIEEATTKNRAFRKVLYTGHLQLVLMSLKPQEDIGAETHSDVDQFIRVEKGSATVMLGTELYELKEDEAVIIPAGYKHNIINRSKTKALKLYTIYAPAEHPPGTYRLNKPTH